MRWWARAGLLCALSGTAVAGGFRGDGTGVWPEGDLASLASAPVCWKTPTAGWSNSSVAPHEGQGFFTQEPTQLAAVNLTDGALQWTLGFDVSDTLQGEERAALQAEVAAAVAAEKRLGTAKARYASLRRDLRRSGIDVAAVAAEMDALGAEVEALNATIAAVAWARTPADKGMIGYASSTPLVRDGAVYAMFGNGVVGRAGLDGTRDWAVHLGAPSERMHGWEWGHGASLQWAADVLIVPWVKVRALDPATGAVRWTGPDFADYGTPAIATFTSGDVVLLPDGQALDAATGTSLATDLGELWYVGPVVASDGDTATVIYGGGRAGLDLKEQGGFYVSSTKLTRQGDTLTRDQAWRTLVPDPEGVYATPLLTDEHVVVIVREGRVHVLNRATGVLERSFGLGEPFIGADAMQSPVAVGDRVLVGSDKGTLFVLDLLADDPIVAQRMLEPQRGTPWVWQGRMLQRTLTAVWCLDLR